MIRCALVISLAFVLALPGAALAAPDRTITRATYSFSAAAGPLSTSKGSGNVRKTGDFLAVVRGRAREKTFASRVSLWSVDRRTPSARPATPKTTLVLTVEVTSSLGGCRVGTRGTVTLVDWNRKLDNGRSSDRVRVRFPAGSCHAFSGTWSNASGGARVRVEIAVRF